MKLSDFLDKNGSKMKYLETKFLKDIYFEDYGEVGLEMIQSEYEIPRNDGTGKVWRIDFVVLTKDHKFAIELHGFNYHAAGVVDRERFDELQRKENEIRRQGFQLITMSRSQIEEQVEEGIFELRRFFNCDKSLYSIFLRRNTGKITPHDVQEKALYELKNSRLDGENRGLVVLATGLGKTYLGIFDAVSCNADTILFVVHNDYILKQARNSFEKIMPERSNDMGFFTGKEKTHVGKKIIFATIQTINKTKESNLYQFKPDFFDYIIFDETHHIAAPSYKTVIDYFNAKYILGLTATPNRLDKKDVLPFFHNNLVYEKGQVDAIKEGYLASMNYMGFIDNVDYSNIYFNGFRYDVNDLNKLLMIEKRNQAIIDKYNQYAKGKKTIGFCVSIQHADRTAKSFRDAGIDAVSIHSKISGDEYGGEYQSSQDIIKAFDEGKHQMAFVVDMLNEGIDIPDVECILMLRPTESATILTQQIGRGLRLSHGKSEVTILDFIGNYRTSHTILGGLGLKKLSELKFDKEKGVYYYDNDGRTIMFEESVVEIFKKMISNSSREVNEELISDDWMNYGTFLEEQTSEGNNLYRSVGKKNNDLNSHLWAINFMRNNTYSSNEEISIKLQEESKKEFPSATLEGIRALFYSKLVGIIVETSPLALSNAGEEIISHYNNGLNTDVLLSNQIEKFYFFNDIASLTNRHSEEGRQRDVHKLFFIYPLFFIYQLLIYLESEGYEEPSLTRFEINFFVIFCKTHDDIIPCARMIINYRKYSEIAELEKFLIRKNGMDSRFYKTLMYAIDIEYSQKQISIKKGHLEIVKSKIIKFNELLNSGKLIHFNLENNSEYRNMLYSSDDLITYHTNL